MNYRNIARKLEGHPLKVGNLPMWQALPSPETKDLSPFLLLHHAGPVIFPPGENGERIHPHPHRGFEPVTFLFSGELHHKDSLGHEGFLRAGDVQWMTAGSGILHSEGPAEAWLKKGGTLELVQLWVNLPRDNKMTEPAYQNLSSEVIPLVEADGGRVQLKVVAGSFGAVTGPAQTFSPLLAIMIHFEQVALWEVPVERAFNATAYLLEGSVTSGTNEFSARELAVFNHSGDTLRFESHTAGRMLLLAGTPLQEPVASYGPFVMNYPGEIKQAILDYESGAMCQLAE